MKVSPRSTPCAFLALVCFPLLLHQIRIGDYSSTSSFPTGGVSVIPDHAGTDSGSTPSDAGVFDTGAAQIRIPTAGSPGTAGMQPQVAVDSSQATNGPSVPPRHPWAVTKITDTARNATLFTSDETAHQRGKSLLSSILDTI